ncbi:MAG: PA2778 family cysteine peptidase [Gammaproteobacteria bacterium]|nr:PA2778 family cysteine peptidase [Gammaproteobacteria bacterium]
MRYPGFEKTRLLAGFFVLLMMGGCAGLPELPENLTTRVELTETPFYPQEEYQCGPAALATVLSFRGLEITPDELTPQVFLPERKGSLQIELTATARRYGMLAYPLSGSLSDLLSEVAAGNPVLVLQNLAFGWWPRWHYAVVMGFDLEQQEIILRSGREKRWRSRLTAFNNTWARASNWALVILPPERLPQTAKPGPYLRAAYDLETTNKPHAALRAYHTASKRWPKDKRPWLALGNSAYNLNQLDEARTALERALSIDPEDIIALNNLAYVYLAAGCGAEAMQTIDQAQQIKPTDSNLRASREDIVNGISRLKSTRCSLSTSR